jgi:protein TonB
MAQLQASRPAPRPSFRSPVSRALSLGGVAALHLAAIYAFVNALGVVSLPSIPNVLEVFTVAPQVEKSLPPPPPPPVVELPKPVEPVLPEVTVDLQQSAPTTAITVPPPGLAPAAPDAPPRVADTDVRAVASTHTIPLYPPLSRRLGETGKVSLTLTIGEDGSVVDAKVEHSSGSQRLDEAAEEWVKAHWRYQPAIRDGRLVQAMTTADVIFKLT